MDLQHQFQVTKASATPSLGVRMPLKPKNLLKSKKLSLQCQAQTEAISF